MYCVRHLSTHVAKRLARPFRSTIPILWPPYEYIQTVVEEQLHRYICVGAKQIAHIVIVGAHLGYEITRMSRSYPMARFTVFEASPRYFPALERLFARKKHVDCVHAAVTDKAGIVTFLETSAKGAGSLLRVSDNARQDYGLQQAESYTVTATSLDDYFHSMSPSAEIDLLWIDVQGAEMSVLRGANSFLKRVRALFVEVACLESSYEKGTQFCSIMDLVGTQGFCLAGLGTDSLNLTGNAFFVQPRLIGTKRYKL